MADPSGLRLSQAVSATCPHPVRGAAESGAPADRVRSSSPRPVVTPQAVQESGRRWL